ncbi:MAG: hypothetical protein AAF702_09230 [Chloroflexota bacterium]
MWKLIDNYSLNWRANTNTGVVYLYFADGTIGYLRPDSIQELAAIGDILRNEKPVFYHTDSGDISTGREPSGEEES